MLYQGIRETTRGVGVGVGQVEPGLGWTGSGAEPGASASPGTVRQRENCWGHFQEMGCVAF